MIAGTLVGLALCIAWARHRFHRKQTLAGLDGSKPVFSVEPPHRRLGSRKGERL